MKRHPSLVQLSREHHPALVLARGLTASSGEPAAARLVRLQRVWQEDLQPHFLREERALVPLSLCAEAALRDHARSIAQQHAVLRQRFGGLSEENVLAEAVAISSALEEHVRFEERVWFPALQQSLAEATLAQAERRMRPEPCACIAGFHQDEETAWVADLDCGHRQHIRHKPPFQNAAWVTTEAGRNAMIGTELPCPLCRMPMLPACAEIYQRTPPFDEASVPAEWLKRHQLKSGTWARIIVETGRVQYVLEDEQNFTLTLKPGTDGIVAPERPHHVELQPGARFRIAFLRVS